MTDYFSNIYNNIVKYFYDNSEQIIYFDFETTGLNPFYDKIIEYAFLKENLEIPDAKDMVRDVHYIYDFVNPKLELPKKITRITGINDAMLQDSKRIEDKIGPIVDFIESDNSQKYLIAHNCDGFDKYFLKTQLYENGYDNYNNYRYIDTLILARMLIPNLDSYSMASLCRLFEIRLTGHRAMNDTVALRQVYHHLVKIIADNSQTDFNSLLRHPGRIWRYIYE